MFRETVLSVLVLTVLAALPIAVSAQTALPDLTFTGNVSDEVPETVEVNESVEMVFDVVNGGENVTPASWNVSYNPGVELGFSDNQTCMVTPTTMLEPGEYCTVVENIRFPSAGEYTITIRLDANEEIKESNEDDNVQKIFVEAIGDKEDDDVEAFPPTMSLPGFELDRTNLEDVSDWEQTGLSMHQAGYDISTSTGSEVGGTVILAKSSEGEDASTVRAHWAERAQEVGENYEIDGDRWIWRSIEDVPRDSPTWVTSEGVVVGIVDYTSDEYEEYEEEFSTLADELQERYPPAPRETGDEMCAQVITPAKNPETGTCKRFSTPCNVPDGWEKVASCGNTEPSTCKRRTPTFSGQSAFIKSWNWAGEEAITLEIGAINEDVTLHQVVLAGEEEFAWEGERMIPDGTTETVTVEVNRDDSCSLFTVTMRADIGSITGTEITGNGKLGGVQAAEKEDDSTDVTAEEVFPAAFSLPSFDLERTSSGSVYNWENVNISMYTSSYDIVRSTGEKIAGGVYMAKSSKGRDPSTVRERFAEKIRTDETLKDRYELDEDRWIWRSTEDVPQDSPVVWTTSDGIFAGVTGYSSNEYVQYEEEFSTLADELQERYPPAPRDNQTSIVQKIIGQIKSLIGKFL